MSIVNENLQDKTLAVVLLTAHRLDYAQITLKSLLTNLSLPDGVNLHVHIASDGDDQAYIDTLKAIVRHSGHMETSVSNSEGRGYGANYNLAMQTVHQIPGVEWVLPLEDDWELVRKFDVSPVLSILDRYDPAHYLTGCVRLGYMGYTQELIGSFFKHRDLNWILLHPDSPEPHVFAGHPRIETVWWEKAVGPWTEGLQPGATEFEVAHRESARAHVVWPVDLVKPCGDAFVHIGTIRSY
jgi:hypothetical protein